VIASTASLPTPGHIKIDSIIAVPPNKDPMDKPNKVTIVSSELFSTLKYRIIRSFTQRERAPKT